MCMCVVCVRVDVRLVSVLLMRPCTCSCGVPRFSSISRFKELFSALRRYPVCVCVCVCAYVRQGFRPLNSAVSRPRSFDLSPYPFLSLGDCVCVYVCVSLPSSRLDRLTPSFLSPLPLSLSLPRYGCVCMCVSRFRPLDSTASRPRFLPLSP